MAVLAATMCVSFTSCDDKEPNGGGDGNIQLAGKFQIEERVYNEETGETTYITKDAPSGTVDEIEVRVGSGNYEDTSVIGTYSVNNINFSFTLPTPPAESLLSLAETFEFPEVTLSNEDAKYVSVHSFVPLKDGKQVGKLYIHPSEIFQLANGKIELIEYFYSDRAVNIIGVYSTEDIYGDVTSRSIREYDVKLKKGWNVVIGIRTNTESERLQTRTDKFFVLDAPSGNTMASLQLN